MSRARSSLEVITLFNKYYSGKIEGFYNVLEQSTTVMVDEDGHGTHIAGTIAEGTPDNVKILPIKVSRTGSMYYSDIIAAIAAKLIYFLLNNYISLYYYMSIISQ